MKKMPQPPLKLPRSTVNDVEANISKVIEIGSSIRNRLGGHGRDDIWDEKWEVQAAVEALDVMASRWTIEIMSALYIAGAKRFNQLKHLLKGISSRTLSDKLKLLREHGYISRDVDDGPPIRVEYILTDHGKTCGRLLSPLVAHLKVHTGSVVVSDE